MGQTLSHYQILDKLGEGGMGEVYRARDEVLGREVAIKVLPEAFTEDPERLARFEREAKVLASLNHPHIAAIYGLEEDDGQRFLVLELVEGETLGERLAGGALAVEEAVRLSIQIAQALEAAHEKGIIHRDLKPANVKVTPDGEVKVLDFGLAKPTEAAFQGDLTESPTLTYAPTGAGVILGTAAYMSPEQVRGQEVDKRADIWAFGVVLWEMLTGERLFGGDTVSDVLASTLMREPDWAGLPAGLPTGVTRALRRCLVQDPKQRLHDIADARIELQEALEEPETPPETVATQTPLWLRLAPWLAAVLALAAGWLLRPVPKPEPLPTVRFEIPVPEGERLTHVYRHGIAFSPDGSTLAHVLGRTSGFYLPDESRIHVRRMDSFESRPVPGADRSGQPIFSPDGEWLAFNTLTPDLRSVLRKVRLDGGEPETICECDASFGASWGPDDKIVFGGFETGLQTVSVLGGNPEVLTVLDEATHESLHALPHHLPEGKGVLFTVLAGPPLFGDPGSIHVTSVSDGIRKRLIAEGSDARYVPTGHLVYARAGQLYATSFDLDRLEVLGPEIPVLEGVVHSIHAERVMAETMAAQFSLSAFGSLAYLEGSVLPEVTGVFLLADREGRIEPTEMEPKVYLAARTHEDQRRVLLTVSYPPRDAWVYDLERKTTTRQTFSEKTSWAIWGPGPEEITFSSVEDGVHRIFFKPVNAGPGGAQRLMGEEAPFVQAVPGSWSPDGTGLAFVVPPSAGWNEDIWIFSRDTSVAEPFLHSEYLENHPEFSPDGRWLAYVSDESGQGEVYVRPYPGPGPSIQISTAGGSSPAWSPDGAEIYFHHWEQGIGQFYTVPLETEGGGLVAGMPQLLFGDADYGECGPNRCYGVLADSRFLILGMPSDADMQVAIEKVFPDRIHVVQNWLAELEQKMPARK